MSAQAETTPAGAATAAMHASIWRFTGDPDALLPRYDAMVADIGASRMVFHACLRAPDGLVIVDTCPTLEAYLAFRDADWFRELLERHGLPAPEVVDYPVHLAVADGRRVS